MSPQELTTPTAFALGLITCALLLTAGLSLLGTGYTIEPRKVRNLKTRALKTLLAAAITGSSAVVIATSF